MVNWPISTLSTDFGLKWASLTQTKRTLYHESFGEPEAQRGLSTCIIKSVIMSALSSSSLSLTLNSWDGNIRTRTSAAGPLLVSAACLICSPDCPPRHFPRTRPTLEGSGQSREVPSLLNGVFLSLLVLTSPGRHHGNSICEDTARRGGQHWRFPRQAGTRWHASDSSYW